MLFSEWKQDMSARRRQSKLDTNTNNDQQQNTYRAVYWGMRRRAEYPGIEVCLAVISLSFQAMCSVLQGQLVTCSTICGISYHSQRCWGNSISFWLEQARTSVNEIVIILKFTFEYMAFLYGTHLWVFIYLHMLFNSDMPVGSGRFSLKTIANLL